MRLFLAIDIPDPLRVRLAELQRQMLRANQALKPVHKDRLHLTVLFLGEVKEEQLPQIRELAAAAARRHAPFSLSLCGTGAFPSGDRPRVLWAGARGGSDLFVRLCVDVREAFSGLVAKDDRPPAAHVTLARNPKVRYPPRLTEVLRSCIDVEIGGYQVTEVTLYQSVLSSGGPRYTALARFPLGCAEPAVG